MKIVALALNQRYLLLKHSLVLVEEDQYTSFHDAILESMTCGGTQINVSDLRQRNLKLSFFKILPISNTGDSIAYILATVHFLYPKLSSFSDMEYYFHQLAYWDSKVSKRFVGLNQMQCSPSFDWNCDKQNDPTSCWYQLHPQFQVLHQGKWLRYPTEHVGGVTETTYSWACA